MSGITALSPIICPICDKKNKAVIGKDLISYYATPEEIKNQTISTGVFTTNRTQNEIGVEFYICPYCGETSIKVYDFEHDRDFSIYPISNAKKFEDKVPKNIYRDYSEAKATLQLSPRASSALSRRCLQAMIHNRWDINLGNLCNEINNIPSEKITKIERDALNAIRQIGNIGAHPDAIVDVNSKDAELLVSVIEIFLQKWYIDDVQLQNLLNEAIEANKNKSEQKRLV